MEIVEMGMKDVSTIGEPEGEKCIEDADMIMNEFDDGRTIYEETMT